MKLKNVLAGLKKEYDLKEINIITPSRVIASMTLEQWENVDPCLLRHKRKLEETEIENRMIFNGKKAFLFISEIEL